MPRPLLPILLAALLGLGAACSDRGLRSGEARLTVDDGRALVGRAGDMRPVTGTARVRQGELVRVVSGQAVVHLDGGGSYELRRGSELRYGEKPELVRGDVLTVAAGRSLVVRVDGSEVTVAEVASVSRSLAVSVSAYRGTVELASSGRSFRVLPLRHAAIPAFGVLPTRANPIAYDDGDEWDRRFLAAAVAVGEQLEARAAAFDSNVPAARRRSADFYRLLLPELAREEAFAQELLDARATASAGETLVGATIAVTSTRSSFAVRWRSIFDFRDEGAHWGLVALDQGVARAAPLVDTLDAAIGRAPLGFTPEGQAIAAAQARAGTRPRDAAPVPPSPPPTPPPPPAPPRRPPPPAPPRQGPLPDAPGPAAPLLQPAIDTINGLLQGSGGPGGASVNVRLP